MIRSGVEVGVAAKVEVEFGRMLEPSTGKLRCPTHRPSNAGDRGDGSIYTRHKLYVMPCLEVEINPDINVGGNAYETSSGLFVVAIAGSGSSSNGDDCAVDGFDYAPTLPLPYCCREGCYTIRLTPHPFLAPYPYPPSGRFRWNTPTTLSSPSWA